MSLSGGGCLLYITVFISLTYRKEFTTQNSKGGRDKQFVSNPTLIKIAVLSLKYQLALLSDANHQLMPR